MSHLKSTAEPRVNGKVRVTVEVHEEVLGAVHGNGLLRSGETPEAGMGRLLEEKVRDLVGPLVRS